MGILIESCEGTIYKYLQLRHKQETTQDKPRTKNQTQCFKKVLTTYDIIDQLDLELSFISNSLIHSSIHPSINPFLHPLVIYSFIRSLTPIMFISRIKLYSSTFHHVRNLNDTWENTKDKSIDIYEGLKYTVLKNTILSICIASAVIGLLILCCYLRRKHGRNATVMSKREHAKLLKQRAERSVANENNRKSPSDKNKKGKKGKKGKRGDAQQDESDLANSSFDTKATILSDTDKGFNDIEKGGIELKLDDDFKGDNTSPIKGENEKKKFGFFRRS